MPHSLVIDDTKEKRDQLVDVLEEALGLPVKAFRSSAEGLAHIRDHAQNVVAALIDYSFPAEQIKGIELIRALRDLNKTCYIALVTSHPQSSSEYKTRKGAAAIAGANESYSTNMLPHNAYDWLYMELCEKKADLLRKFGLLQGFPKDSTKD